MWTALSAESTANQKSKDAVVALALDGRSIRYGKQFFSLVTRQPVSQPRPLLTHVWYVGHLRGLLRIQNAVPLCFTD